MSCWQDGRLLRCQLRSGNVGEALFTIQAGKERMEEEKSRPVVIARSIPLDITGMCELGHTSIESHTGPC